MKKHIGTALIIIGLLVIAFPLVGRYIADQKQKEMMEAFYLDSGTTGSSSSTEYTELNSIFDETNTVEGQEALDDYIEEHGSINLDGGSTDSTDEDGMGNALGLNESSDAIGVMNIDKIDFRGPIAEGADLETLNYSIGHMESTAELGTIGNSVVAGHRSHSFGKYFNRLDELEKGDEIVVETYDGTFTYVVYEILIVEPTDLSVLRGSSEYRVLTLITCDPVYNPTHRLIIHAIDKNQL